jgi:NIMA (never in mitosis gene a)-related kinase
MITLKPPFRAENMEGLYNKVIKGQISKIPERFSPDLWEVVKMLIQVTPESRPNCGKDILINKKYYLFNKKHIYI